MSYIEKKKKKIDNVKDTTAKWTKQKEKNKEKN